MFTKVNAVGLGLVIASTACVSRPELPLVAYGPSDHEPVIEVTNRYFQGMEVTLVLGGRSYRLGDVPAFGTARFALPSEAPGAAARISLKPTGDLKVYRTRLVQYSGVDDLRLFIDPDPVRSALIVRE